MTYAVLLHEDTSRMTTVSAQAPKNFGLSVERFEELAAALKRGDETLFEQVFVSQFWKRVRHLRSAYDVSEPDAKDAVMNALLDFRRLLINDKVSWGNLEAYFTRIVITGYQKKRQRNPEIPTEQFSTERADDDAPPDFSKEQLDAFAAGWKSLCEKCRAVLQGYYYDDLSMRDLALRLDRSTDSVKQDKHRCIEKLRKIIYQNPL